MNAFERYFKAVDFLEGLSNMGTKHYLKDRSNPSIFIKRTEYFLRLIGVSEQYFKFIHVTGTAGKSTVTTTLHEALHAAGKNVGSFTSPFVTTSIEKIKVKDKYISPDTFVDIVDFLKPYINKAHVDGQHGTPSYFEIFLAIAFLYFQQQKCEWVVLEAGLGGRYDATNVLSSPKVTAITNIGLDHTDVLGTTLSEIASDKAGIIKEGSVFFTSEQRPSLLKLFQKICDEKGVPLEKIPSQDNYRVSNQAMVTEIGKHIGIEDRYIKQGFKRAFSACRFEIVQQSPLVILDGAHNELKMKSTIFNLDKLSFRHLHLVIGVADDKLLSPLFKNVLPLARYVYITRFQIKSRRCAEPKMLLEQSKKYLPKGAMVNVFLDPNEALSTALENAGKRDVILVTGSFYLAGELRKKWFAEKWVLEHRRSI